MTQHPLSYLSIARAGVFGNGRTADGDKFSVTTYHRDLPSEYHRLRDDGLGYVVDSRPIASDSRFVSWVVSAPMLNLGVSPGVYIPFLGFARGGRGAPQAALPIVASWKDTVVRGASIDDIGIHGMVLYWYLRGSRIGYRHGDSIRWHVGSLRDEFLGAGNPRRLTDISAFPWMESESVVEPFPVLETVPKRGHSLET